jgi:regulator of protease activity HflC (stomatin/prohibitin superfamily)
VRSDEESVRASEYNVFDYETQIVALARTTLRNIIGTMTLKEANSERGKINTSLYTNLASETKNWGLEIVRTELKEINPPSDVQETMNKVVKASNEKIAAIDFATARETQADGKKRAAIKEADIKSLADPLKLVESHKVKGGPAPAEVKRAWMDGKNGGDWVSAFSPDIFG